MTEAPPETQYAQTARGLNIAYQTIGAGPRDLVFMPWFATNVEANWDLPSFRPFVERLASFSRVILFDRLGTGLSDPIALQGYTLETWGDDLATVLDAADSDHAVLFAADNAGPGAILFAGVRPERVTALVLANTFARVCRAPDYPCGVPRQLAGRWIEELARNWSQSDGVGVDGVNPTIATEPLFARAQSRYSRLTASPGMIAAVGQMLLEVDVREVLPAIKAPTLVIHRTGDQFLRAALGRYLADNIPGATFFGASGQDHTITVGPIDDVLDEVEGFLTGVRRHPTTNRVLSTVLFSDVVESTGHAARLGDRLWRQLLDRYEETARTLLPHFTGRFVNSTGDGTLATFDGPARAVAYGLELAQAARSAGIELRIGIHTGEIELRGEDISGLAVHIAARVQGEADAGEVLVSRTVVDLAVGSTFDFEDRGSRQLKGVPGTWHVFAARHQRGTE